MPEGVPTKDAWSSPARGVARDIDRGWVVATWAKAEAITVGIGCLVAGVTALVGSMERAVEVLTWGLTIVGFLTFLLVLRSSLPHVGEARFFNSLSVGALHVGASVVALLVLFGGNAVAPSVDVVEGLFVLERTAILVVLASLLAPAIVPEHGPVPTGTQGEEWDELHRL